jgi:hypothetical protein
MDPKVEDKPVTPPAPAAGSDKDERGVDWKNRAMEYERKLKDLETKVTAMQPPPAPVVPPDTQKELEHFVADPQGYLENHYQRRRFQEELPKAEKWLSEQAHFPGWDRAKEVIRNHGIDFSDPHRGARTVNEILKAEALEREFNEKKREKDVTKSGPEGGSRSAPVENKTTRRDLIKQLAAAQRKGDLNESMRLIDKLEDVRE